MTFFARDKVELMESWPSGLRQQFAKLRSRKGAHRFESCTLRQITKFEPK